MNKFLIIIFLLINFGFLLPTKVSAVCPVCTIAVGAGLGISRWLGIDDIIASLWIGGLAMSSGLWLANWIKRKEWKIPHKEFLSVVFFYVLLIPTLYLLNVAGNPTNTLWGMDKIILGIIIGSTVFWLSTATDKFLRSLNNEQVFIYYQKVILPMLFLSIISLIFYLIIN